MLMWVDKGGGGGGFSGFAIRITVWGKAPSSVADRFFGQPLPGPGQQTNPGGHGRDGNSSGGTFLHRMGRRLNCAARFGDAHSLASATRTQNSFLGKAFLGNTISGLVQLGLLVVGGPTEATVTDVGIAVLSGTHQGLPARTPIGQGPLGVAQDAIVGAVATAGYNAVVGAGSQTLELGINASGKVATGILGLSETTAAAVAGVIGAAKLVGDFSTFAYGGIFKCK